MCATSYAENCCLEMGSWSELVPGFLFKVRGSQIEALLLLPFLLAGKTDIVQGRRLLLFPLGLLRRLLQTDLQVATAATQEAAFHNPDMFQSELPSPQSWGRASWGQTTILWCSLRMYSSFLHRGSTWTQQYRSAESRGQQEGQHWPHTHMAMRDGESGSAGLQLPGNASTFLLPPKWLHTFLQRKAELNGACLPSFLPLLPRPWGPLQQCPTRRGFSSIFFLFVWQALWKSERFSKFVTNYSHYYFLAVAVLIFSKLIFFFICIYWHSSFLFEWKGSG